MKISLRLPPAPKLKTGLPQRSPRAALAARAKPVARRVSIWLNRRTPRSAVVGLAGLSLVLIICMAVPLVSARNTADAVQAELATTSNNYDSVKAAWEKQHDEIVSLKRTAASAEERDAELTAAEAAVEASEATLTSRSDALDVREASVSVVEATVAANTFSGNGTFRVGVDVQPGTYTSKGGSNCYWARLNATGDDIIDNNISSGPAVLTVQGGDGLIKTSSCAPFTKAG